MHTPNNKLRSQVADVLAALCVLSLEGHRLVLNAFSDFRQVHEEKFRFQYLMDTLKFSENEDSVSMEYRSACLSLVNAIVTSPEDVEERMMLRKEFERRGLTELFLSVKNSDPPESLLTQVNVYEDENQEDLEELYDKVHDFVRDANDPFSILVGLVRQVEHDEELYIRVVETLKNLLRIICKDMGETSPNEIWTIVELFIERIRSLTNIEDEWRISMNEFLSSVQYIVGKYSIVSGYVTDDMIDSMKEKLAKVEDRNSNKDEDVAPEADSNLNVINSSIENSLNDQPLDAQLSSRSKNTIPPPTF
ncbi:10233_t:CDS:2, partial [Acaulospora colombiana]